MPRRHHILVIDDDAAMRSMLADYLRGEDYEVSESDMAISAFAKITSGELATDVVPATANPLDLVITDLNMPGMTGIEFTKRFHDLAPNVPVILITAFGTIATAIEAIKNGAYDYITKPFKLTEMTVAVTRALRFRDLHGENRRLQAQIEKNHSFANIIGKSQGMQEVFDLVKRVAHANANVLINGESGTGKERVARAIHDHGPRRQKRFVALNCTAIPESLLESELFGHAKGAFTGALNRKRGLFEEAEGGTLFLDEIGDMNMALQAKLLRVIQERKIRAVGDNIDRDIDVRIIAATHKDLKQAIKNASFREDLYYRLAVIPIVIPPLRHRMEDIPLLADHFLRKYAAENKSPVRSFSTEALRKLELQSWEGNVRELENAIERAIVLARSEQIEAGDLPGTTEKDIDTFFSQNQYGSLPTLEELEKRYMKFVLEKTGGKKEKTAQILGCNRRTLYRKEREYGFINEDLESEIENETESESEADAGEN
ncbi:MAG: sigma-54-dependent Fis family transcriptional regulator [Proteobacteria bacterium]|nr:MAG: sigma-54-dependent Fis family transcriptional regulator [Pseudomonadota bacterium]